MVYVKMVNTIVIGKSHGKDVVGRLTDDSTSLLGSLTKQKVFLSDARRHVNWEAISLLICLEATNFVLPRNFTLIVTIFPKMWVKPLSKNAQSPLSFDVRRSKMSLLKLRNVRCA